MPELDGKVAIVTGAGRLRGIGRARRSPSHVSVRMSW